MTAWVTNRSCAYEPELDLDSSCECVVNSLRNNEINFIALDFDLTLISANTNGWVVSSSNWDEQVHAAAIRIRPVFLVLVPKLLKNGIFVAIVSFSNHRGFIKAVLEKGFGGAADQIPIRDRGGINSTWEYRGKGASQGKQWFIASAAEQLHTRKTPISRKSTVLVDDDPDNVHVCLSESVRAVRYDPHKPESARAVPSSSDKPNSNIEDEIDPLDAYMNSIQETVKKDSEEAINKPIMRPEILSLADQDDDEDYGYVNPENSKYSDDEDGDDYAGYDSNEDIKRNPSGGVVQSLPQVDHRSIVYDKFRRNFYRIHPEMMLKTEDEITEIRNKLELSIEGDDIPPPLLRFEHAGFDSALLLEIYRQGYQNPTPIQAQAIPLALSGRNLIGLAKTGQGKTLAFIWSMIVHVISQPKSNALNGPIGLVLAPTRELVEQIYHEANKYTKLYDLHICPIFGGAGKYEMTKALKNGPQIVLATPGRLIEMVKIKSTSLMNCTIVVLDEADRMFDMGFESQIRCILDNIRGDRQVLLFSATMRKKVEDFVRKTILNPSSSAADLGSAYSGSDKGFVRLSVGLTGQANSDIQQSAVVVRTDQERWEWLSRNVDDFISSGKVLIFVSGKQDSEDLSKSLNEYFSHRQLAVKLAYLHGDMDQSERSQIIKRFSRQSDILTDIIILVATDVASRGLDIKNIQTVINYAVPKNIDTYIHRIGRTGRLGISGVKPGTAYTVLLASKDSSFAVDLVQVLNSSNQQVSRELQLLAETDSRWAKFKYGGQQSKTNAGPSAGLGMTNKRAMTSEMLVNQSKMDSSKHPIHHNEESRQGKLMTNQSSLQIPAPLKGFVRSSQTLHSVQSISSDAVNAQDSQRKRSRWDT